MGKSRRWRKAMLEWLKEMWRSCVGYNTKHGEWTLPQVAEIHDPCFAGMLFLACCLALAIFFVFSILQIFINI